MVSGSRPCHTFILSDHPHRPSRHFDGALGFTLAERVPEVDKSFVLFQSEDITRARSAFNLLNTLGVWLPVIVLILLVLGVYVAKDHRRALVGAGLGVALAMLALALGLAVFRSVYLNGVPAEVLPHDAAAVLYDTVVRFLRAGLRTILVVGLVVAAGAFLTGQSVTAVRARQSLAGGIGWLRGGAEQAGLRTGPGRHLGGSPQARPPHRRGRSGQPGAGVLEPPHRQGGRRPGAGAAGRPGHHRVPRTTDRTHRRGLHDPLVGDVSGRPVDAGPRPRPARERS